MDSVRIKIAIFFVAALYAFPAGATHIGFSSDSPGYSIKHILSHNPKSQSGVYWIDPDGNGTDKPFLAFGDMSTCGGGWTLAHSGQGNARPSMDTHAGSISTLAKNQSLHIRFEGPGVNAFYKGRYGEPTPSAYNWIVISGNASSLHDKTWAQATARNYDIWIRETWNQTPATVLPTSDVWLMGTGLICFSALIGFWGSSDRLR